MADTEQFDDVFSMMEGAEGHGELAQAAIERTKALPIWTGPVKPTVQPGGVSNLNLIVEDRGRKYAIRCGEDEPHIGVFRENEVNAYRAAAAIGLAPEVIHSEKGLIVAAFVEGKVLTPADARSEHYLPSIVERLRFLHDNAHRHLDGNNFMFWPFHHSRWYINQGMAFGDVMDKKWRDVYPDLITLIDELEEVTGRVRIVFSHNDIQPQNFIDDGKKLWLVDWEYAGFSADLFDLGMAGMVVDTTPEETRLLLESYFQAPMTDELRRRFEAQVVIACVREMTWSFMAEVTPRPVDFDWRIYSDMNYERFLKRLAVYREAA